MRMLMTVRCPLEPFNTLIRKGTAGDVIGRILETIKPEAAYFTEQEGQRGALLVINMESPSQIPFFAEPWFLQLNATCEFRVAMTADDLKKSGLSELGKKWGQ